MRCAAHVLISTHRFWRRYFSPFPLTHPPSIDDPTYQPHPHPQEKETDRAKSHARRRCRPRARRWAAPAPGSPDHGPAPVVLSVLLVLVIGGGGVVVGWGLFRFVGRWVGGVGTEYTTHHPTPTSNFVALRPAMPHVSKDEDEEEGRAFVLVLVLVGLGRALRRVLAMYSQTNLLWCGCLNGGRFWRVGVCGCAGCE